MQANLALPRRWRFLPMQKALLDRRCRRKGDEDADLGARQPAVWLTARMEADGVVDAGAVRPFLTIRR